MCDGRAKLLVLHKPWAPDLALLACVQTPESHYGVYGSAFNMRPRLTIAIPPISPIAPVPPVAISVSLHQDPRGGNKFFSILSAITGLSEDKMCIIWRLACRLCEDFGHCSTPPAQTPAFPDPQLPKTNATPQRVAFGHAGLLSVSGTLAAICQNSPVM